MDAPTCLRKRCRETSKDCTSAGGTAVRDSKGNSTQLTTSYLEWNLYGAAYAAPTHFGSAIIFPAAFVHAAAQKND